MLVNRLIRVGAIAITSTLLVSLLRLSGGLQFLEWAALDLFFVLRPREPIDERVVIVALQETDLQVLEESVISDRTLVALLEEIRSQSPRAIGVNLYRDLREPDSKLTEEQNDLAYQELQEIYRTTPNLRGIEKVVPPTIAPPPVLKELRQTAGSEIKVDRDGIVRQGYVISYELVEGSEQAKVPGLGAALATLYLEEEGIEAEAGPQGWMQLGEIEFEKFQGHDGGYVRADELGYPILINWRVGEKRFLEVSVSDVLGDKVPDDLFSNRVVLIGNNASSTGKRFYFPFNRWSQESPEGLYALEAHAQLASYLVSAVLDGRPLLRTLPDQWEYIGLFFVTGAIAVVSERWRYLPPRKFQMVMGAIALGGAVVLVGGSYLLFLEGWWIPVVPYLLGIGGAWIGTNARISGLGEFLALGEENT